MFAQAYIDAFCLTCASLRAFYADSPAPKIDPERAKRNFFAEGSPLAGHPPRDEVEVLAQAMHKGWNHYQVFATRERFKILRHPFFTKKF
jgi:hypothetical protein